MHEQLLRSPWRLQGLAFRSPPSSLDLVVHEQPNCALALEEALLPPLGWRPAGVGVASSPGGVETLSSEHPYVSTLRTEGGVRLKADAGQCFISASLRPDGHGLDEAAVPYEGSDARNLLRAGVPPAHWHGTC